MLLDEIAEQRRRQADADEAELILAFKDAERAYESARQDIETLFMAKARKAFETSGPEAVKEVLHACPDGLTSALIADMIREALLNRKPCPCDKNPMRWIESITCEG